MYGLNTSQTKAESLMLFSWALFFFGVNFENLFVVVFVLCVGGETKIISMIEEGSIWKLMGHRGHGTKYCFNVNCGIR